MNSGIGGRRGAEDTRSHDARPDRRAKQSLGFQNCNTTMLNKGKTITWLPELQYNNVKLLRQNHLAYRTAIQQCYITNAKQSLGFQNCNTTMLYYKSKTITWLPVLQYNIFILQRQNNHMASSAAIQQC